MKELKIISVLSIIIVSSFLLAQSCYGLIDSISEHTLTLPPLKPQVSPAKDGRIIKERIIAPAGVHVYSRPLVGYDRRSIEPPTVAAVGVVQSIYGWVQIGEHKEANGDLIQQWIPASAVDTRKKKYLATDAYGNPTKLKLLIPTFVFFHNVTKRGEFSPPSPIGSVGLDLVVKVYEKYSPHGWKRLQPPGMENQYIISSGAVPIDIPRTPPNPYPNLNEALANRNYYEDEIANALYVAPIAKHIVNGEKYIGLYNVYRLVTNAYNGRAGFNLAMDPYGTIFIWSRENGIAEIAYIKPNGNLGTYFTMGKTNLVKFDKYIAKQLQKFTEITPDQIPKDIKRNLSNMWGKTTVEIFCAKFIAGINIFAAIAGGETSIMLSFMDWDEIQKILDPARMFDIDIDENGYIQL